MSLRGSIGFKSGSKKKRGSFSDFKSTLDDSDLRDKRKHKLSLQGRSIGLGESLNLNPSFMESINERDRENERGYGNNLTKKEIRSIRARSETKNKDGSLSVRSSRKVKASARLNGSAMVKFVREDDVESVLWELFDVPEDERDDPSAYLKKLKETIDRQKNAISRLTKKNTLKSNRETIKMREDSFMESMEERKSLILAPWFTPSGKDIYHFPSAPLFSTESIQQILDFHSFNYLFQKDKSDSIFTLSDRNYIMLNKVTTFDLIDILLIPKSWPLMKVFNYDQYLTDFLLTYPLILSHDDLLNRLTEKYHTVVPEISGYHVQKKMTVLNVIYEWVHMDIQFEKSTTENMMKFLSEREEKQLDSLKSSILEVLISKKTEHQFEKNLNSGIATEPVHFMRIVDIDINTLAKVITVMEHRLFKRIPVSEFIGVVWSTDKKKYIDSSSVMQCIRFSNRLAKIVVTEILRCGDDKDTAETISYFINLLEKLQLLNNYSSLYAIVGALHHVSVGRLKRVWATLKKESEILKKKSELMSSLKHYKAYKRVIDVLDSTFSCIPALSITLENIQKLDDAVELFVDDHINWTKIETLSGLVLDCTRFKGEYNFPLDKAIRDYIDQYEIWEEEHCWEVSIRRTRSDVETSFAVTNDLWQYSEITEKDWRVIMAVSTRLTFEHNDIILSEEVPHEKIYRIVSGRIIVHIEKADGVERRILSTGNTFGEEAILSSNEINKENFKAMSEVVIDVISANKLLEHFNNEGEYVNKIMFYAATRKAEKMFGLLKENIDPSERFSQASSSSLLLVNPTSRRFLKNVVDDKFLKKFDLNDEAVIRVTPCKLKNGNTYTGYMYISQNYICFASLKHFGVEHEEKIPRDTIKQIVKKKNNIVITIRKKKNKIKISDLEDIDDVMHVFTLKASNKRPLSVSRSRTSDDEIISDSEQSYELTKEEFWDIIIKGAELCAYKKGDIIINQGSIERKLYKLHSGSCKVEQDGTLTLDFITPGTGVFGELLFLGKSPSLYSVVADSDIAKVYIIEPSFLNVLFQYDLKLPRKLFQFLGNNISSKIEQIGSVNNSIQTTNLEDSL